MGRLLAQAGGRFPLPATINPKGGDMPRIATHNFTLRRDGGEERRYQAGELIEERDEGHWYALAHSKDQEPRKPAATAATQTAAEKAAAKAAKAAAKAAAKDGEGQGGDAEKAADGEGEGQTGEGEGQAGEGEQG